MSNMLAASSFGPALVVGRDCTWLRLPDGTRVDLERRRVLSRLLSALVDQRLSTPEQPIAPDRLLARTWPDERMSPASGLNRLRVSIAMLRGLGLAPFLKTHRLGYQLDPSVEILPA